jgi:hypothetical protein
MTMPLKHYHHLFPQAVPHFPAAVQEMYLLMLVFLEDYSMTHETNPEDMITISGSEYIDTEEQTSQARHCIIVSLSVFGS